MAKTPEKHRQPWSEKDVATLKKMAARRPVGIIADTLQRTEDAVRKKAGELDVSMQPPERSPYNRRP